MMTGQQRLTSILLLTSGVLLLGCGEKTSIEVPETSPTVTPAPIEEPVSTSAEPAIEYSALAWAAVSDPARPVEDGKDDVARKPAQVLAFFEVEPGLTVLEMEAGTGYYTELLSRIVGADGKVYMQNPKYFDKFFGEEGLAPRLGDNRLPNVVSTRSQFDVLQPPEDSVDLVTWILGPHELFYFPEDGPEDGFGDADRSFLEIVRVLKPGGVFGVVDHAAAEGAPETTGGTIHRIDSAIIISMAEAAGLELEAESTILRNPADDYEKNVFEEGIRRNTDRFVMRFRKPL